MNETNNFETWQVEAGGQVYETNLDEMTQWIYEGSLLPQDRVRRGNLRWIEAQKVPALLKFFNARDNGAAMPIHTSNAANLSEMTGNFPRPNHQIGVTGSTQTDQYPEFSDFTNSLEKANISKEFELPSNETHRTFPTEPPQISDVCCMHDDTVSAYHCDTCGNAFCKQCPKSYGGNVKICPFCGAMCQPIGKIREDFKKNLQAQTALGEGFGLTDFGRAFAFPFRYRASLIFGAIMFAFFSVGELAAGLGGIIMIFASLVSFMMANTLTFGILSNTISNFSQGKLERDFMPKFEDFSIWDDVLHPFFLSIAAYVSSFGAFILVCVIGFYLVFSSIAAQTKALNEQIEKIPGTHTFDTNRAVQQTDEVKKLLEGVRSQNQNRLDKQPFTAENKPPVVDQTEANVMEMENLIQDTRKQQLESVAGTTSADEQAQMAQIFRGILNLTGPLIIVGFIAFLWGLFYFPAACAVAGYTRSFTATINPLVGLDTIKILGLDYVKVFAMYLVILVVTIVLSGILNLIFLPFDLPKLGNIPAKIIGSLFIFYFSVVFSCILGFVIYKNADKLKLYRG